MIEMVDGFVGVYIFVNSSFKKITIGELMEKCYEPYISVITARRARMPGV